MVSWKDCGDSVEIRKPIAGGIIGGPIAEQLITKVPDADLLPATPGLLGEHEAQSPQDLDKACTSHPSSNSRRSPVN